MQNSFVDLAYSKGFERVEVDTFLPVSLFLRLYGEDIRQMAFMLSDPVMGEVCLRPDFTAPVAYMHATGRTSGAGRYLYSGDVFHRPQRDDEWKHTRTYQYGVEIIGCQDSISTDAEIFIFLHNTLSKYSNKPFNTKIGDRAIATCWIDSLNIHSHWKMRLHRHFCNQERFNKILNDCLCFIRNQSCEVRGGCDTDNIRRVTCETVKRFLPEQKIFGVRSYDDIINRSVELNLLSLEPASLSEEIVQLTCKMMQVCGKVEQSLAELRELARAACLDMETVFSDFEKRLELLASSGICLDKLYFDASFGGHLEYYDGFVFEMTAPEHIEGAYEGCSMSAAFRRMAGGGRYNRMAQSLCDDGSVRAAGGALNVFDEVIR